MIIYIVVAVVSFLLGLSTAFCLFLWMINDVIKNDPIRYPNKDVQP